MQISFAVSIILFISYLCLLYYDLSQYILLSTIIITLLYICYEFEEFRIDSHSIKKFVCGEIIASIMWIGWIFHFQQNVLVFYVPQMLGNIGKIDIMINGKNQTVRSITDDLILFQSKAQFFVLAYEILAVLFNFSQMKVIELFILIIIVKYKYTFNFGTQKACSELHFAIDHLAKKCGFRPGYQILHKMVSYLGRPTFLRGKQIYY